MSTTQRRTVALFVLCARVTAFAAATGGCTRTLAAHDKPVVAAPAGCDVPKPAPAAAPAAEIGMCLADGR